MRHWIALIIGAAFVVTPAYAQTMNPEQFRAMLEDALRKNPEIVQAALMNAAARAEAAAKAGTRAAEVKILERARVPDADTPMLGSPKATITIVEALDYRCPYCRVMYSRIEALLASRHDVRVVIMMTPILGADSVKLARFALAAQQQGRFAEAHAALLTSSDKIVPDDKTLAEISAKIGLDWAKTSNAMNQPRILNRLARDNLDWKSLSSPGTPHIIVPGNSFEGAINSDELIAALPTLPRH